MIIKSAGFLISNTDYNKCPPANLPEYAFIGRSNVGKSSLINLLTNNKNLAKISNKPGKTKLINHFIINEKWYLVDLPGYGYAKVSIKDRDQWVLSFEKYILNRENLVLLFVLIDSRIPPQKIDMKFLRWLGKYEVPFAIVFTKIDKLTKKKVNENISNYKNELLKEWEFLPDIFESSSETKTGRDEILNFIENLNKKFNISLTGLSL
jgi:GTP-binding protein